MLARLADLGRAISGVLPASALPPRTRPAGSMTWTTYSPGAGLPAPGEAARRRRWRPGGTGWPG